MGIEVTQAHSGIPFDKFPPNTRRLEPNIAVVSFLLSVSFTVESMRNWTHPASCLSVNVDLADIL